MSVLKHLKYAQTCFDNYSDHLQGARRFLVKVTEFKSFYRFFKIVKVICGDAAASPQITFTILKNLQKLLNSVTLTRTYKVPEDDLNNDRNTLERF